LGEAVIAYYVAKNPGQSVKHIGNALGLAKKQLQLPIVRRIGAKKLRTTGEPRGKRYFVR
jgi:hypothetical protein